MSDNDNEPIGYDGMGAPIYRAGSGLNYDVRPGGLDGPPKHGLSYRLGQGTAYLMAALIIAAFAWSAAWIVRLMVEHHPF